MQEFREKISLNNSDTQILNEVKSSSPDVRQKLLAELQTGDGDSACHIKIPVGASLAMKSDLNIPWNKLRVIRRYTYHKSNDKLDPPTDNTLDG